MTSFDIDLGYLSSKNIEILKTICEHEMKDENHMISYSLDKFTNLLKDNKINLELLNKCDEKYIIWYQLLFEFVNKTNVDIVKKYIASTYELSYGLNKAYDDISLDELTHYACQNKDKHIAKYLVSILCDKTCDKSTEWRQLFLVDAVRYDTDDSNLEIICDILTKFTYTYFAKKHDNLIGGVDSLIDCIHNDIFVRNGKFQDTFCAYCVYNRNPKSFNIFYNYLTESFPDIKVDLEPAFTIALLNNDLSFCDIILSKQHDVLQLTKFKLGFRTNYDTKHISFETVSYVYNKYVENIIDMHDSYIDNIMTNLKTGDCKEGYVYFATLFPLSFHELFGIGMYENRLFYYEVLMNISQQNLDIYKEFVELE